MCVVCSLTPEQDSTDAFGDSWRGPNQPGTANSQVHCQGLVHPGYFFFIALVLLLDLLVKAVFLFDFQLLNAHHLKTNILTQQTKRAVTFSEGNLCLGSFISINRLAFSK